MPDFSLGSGLKKIKNLPQKFKSSWKLITIPLTIFVLIGLWFYWFQWRPSQVRNDCHKIAMQGAIDKIAHDNLWSKNDYDVYYEVCLHAKGLK